MIHELINSFIQLMTFILLLCPGALSVVSILIFSKFAKNNKTPFLWPTLPVGLAIIYTAIFFFAVAYEPSGFIRFAMFGSMVIGSIITVIIAVIYGIQNRHYFKRNIAIYYSIVSLFILLAGGLGIENSNILINKCETMHVQTGNILANALDDYYKDNKKFPDELSELIPLYIDDDAIETCFKLISLNSLQYGGFQYMKCSTKIAEFYVQQMNLSEMHFISYHVYHFDDHQWDRIERTSEWADIDLCPQE